MKSVIVYGSTLGNCSSAAELLAEKLGDTEIVEVSDFDFSSVEKYDLLILGTSTWGFGDLQDDWEARIDDLRSCSLKGKKVAIFGTGDQESYPDSFVDAMREIYDSAENAGAEIIGSWPCEGYRYSSSRAEIDGLLVGLALDEDNEPDKSPERIKTWVASLI